MRTFETDGPISVALELGVGDVVIAASDGGDTVVDVQPSDATRSADVAAARETDVDLARGTLTVTGPKGWRKWTPWGGDGSVQIRIELPTGSSLRGTIGAAVVHGTGRLGVVRLRSGAGEIALEETGALDLRAGAGDMTVDVVGGRAEIRTSGAVRIGRIDGPAVIRNANGDTWIGEVTGEARVTAANGAISIDLAHAGIVAKTANGNVRLDEVAHGPVVAESAFGRIEVGVPAGVPAWLDLQTRFGQVLSDLDAADRPEPGEGAVEIRAHTTMGDVAIRRAAATGVGERP